MITVHFHYKMRELFVTETLLNASQCLQGLRGVCMQSTRNFTSAWTNEETRTLCKLLYKTK